MLYLKKKKLYTEKYQVKIMNARRKCQRIINIPLQINAPGNSLSNSSIHLKPEIKFRFIWNFQNTHHMKHGTLMSFQNAKVHTP